jgi:hypothetical protein
MVNILWINWLFQLGFAYDTSPVDSDDRAPDMPMDRQIRYATGVQYKWRDRLSVGEDPIVATLGERLFTPTMARLK